jgi:hypothetical protein
MKKFIILLALILVSFSASATKNLKSGEVYTTVFGEEWGSAILVVDQYEPNFKDQVLRFHVDIYKDAQARTDEKRSFTMVFNIDKATFLANFDMTRTAIQLRGDLEDYALTLTENGALIYPQFE